MKNKFQVNHLCSSPPAVLDGTVNVNRTLRLPYTHALSHQMHNSRYPEKTRGVGRAMLFLFFGLQREEHMLVVKQMRGGILLVKSPLHGEVLTG